jgi:hypothetical protein
MEDRRSSAATRGFPGVCRWFLLCAAAVSVSCGSPDSIGRTPEATPSAAKVPPRRDFTISISPIVQSVADGANTSYKVSAAAISGGAQNIQLSLSALPSGVTGAFTPSTIATGHKAVLAIAAGAGAPPTTATFTVTGDNSSVTHTASATLTVLDRTPAAATLLSPPAGSLLAGAVDVSAAASDNVAVSRLEIWLDDTVLASAAGAALVSTWDSTAAADGPHTLTAVAYDTSGNAGSSPPVQVTVGNGPSARDFAIAIVALPAPVADGGTTGFSVSTTTLTGTPQPLALAVSGLPPGVSAAFDRSTVTSGESANVTLSAAADAPGGPFSFTVTAAGIYASRSAAGSGTVVDTLAPAVAMSVPLLVQGSCELRLSAADNTGVARGEIRVDGALVATAFSYSWDTTAASDGSHVVEGRAYDLSGNVGTTGALITTVQNSAATRDFVLALSPGSRTIGDGASTTFSVDTSALLGAPQTVQLSLLGLPAGVTGVLQPPAIGPGTTATLTLNAAPAAAPWTGSICVAGTGVYTTHQACRQLTVVDSTAPVVGLSAPQSGAGLAGIVAVQASATDNIGVVRSELYLDGALVASGPSWNWDTTASADGAHTLEAAAWDAAGNRGSSGQRQVTV